MFNIDSRLGYTLIGLGLARDMERASQEKKAWKKAMRQRELDKEMIVIDSPQWPGWKQHISRGEARRLGYITD